MDIFLKDSQRSKFSNKTYVSVDKDVKSIVDRHKRYLSRNKIKDEVPEYLPFLYWIPKMHKKPYSKQRYIAASNHCSTKPLSAVLKKCLNLVEKQHRIICRRYDKNHGINPMWIIHNSKSVHTMTSKFNWKKMCCNMRTMTSRHCTLTFPTTNSKRDFVKLSKRRSPHLNVHS